MHFLLHCIAEQDEDGHKGRTFKVNRAAGRHCKNTIKVGHGSPGRYQSVHVGTVLLEGPNRALPVWGRRNQHDNGRRD